MRLIPKKHQLKWLSAKDQTYWLGYFNGLADATLLAERKAEEELSTEPMSLGKAMGIIRSMPYGRERDAFVHDYFQIRKRWNQRQRLEQSL